MAAVSIVVVLVDLVFVEGNGRGERVVVAVAEEEVVVRRRCWQYYEV